MKPLAIDLFCGLFGWSDGLLAEGFQVIGFDIEDMHAALGIPRPPEKRLVIQDVLTLHGSQFRDAALIVASPPCQEYSYMAMPWSLAKAKAAAIRADTTGKMLADLNRLFEACFRIQAQASLAAGRHVPMVIENVRGAIPWVGRSRWNFGSFHLWGDVPALMPITLGRSVMKKGIAPRSDGATNFHGQKGIPHRTAGHWTNPAEHEGKKVPGVNWSRSADPDYKPQGFNVVAAQRYREQMKESGDGIKQGGTWWHDEGSISRTTGSKSDSRKAASAMIAKIPTVLSRHIGATYRKELH